MTTGAASIIFLALLTVSIAHFLWSVGSPWPIRDPELLSRTVVGNPNIKRVPRLASFVVAVLVLIAAIIGVSLADRQSGGILLTLAGVGLALIFGARGIIGYLPAWRARFSLEPFATLDRRIYSPLCLVVAACYLILVISRF